MELNDPLVVGESAGVCPSELAAESAEHLAGADVGDLCLEGVVVNFDLEVSDVVVVLHHVDVVPFFRYSHRIMGVCRLSSRDGLAPRAGM